MRRIPGRLQLLRSAFGPLALLGLAGMTACTADEIAGVQPVTPQVYGPARRPSADFDHHADQRAAPTCMFGPSATTRTTIGDTAPDAGVVEHVIVLMMENRSFDHLLSDLPAVGVTDLVSPTPAAATNPDGRTGQQVARSRASSYCLPNAVEHEWGDVHLQYNAGKLDGFVAASDPSAMTYYTHSDLPALYALASQFALSDRHFSSLLGPTWPNRLFLFAATSCGYAEGIDTNPDVTLKCGLAAPNIVKAVRGAGKSVAFYDASGPFAVSSGLAISTIPGGIHDFESDVMMGQLADLVFVGANTGAITHPENDDHPPANVLDGENFLIEVVTALVANPDIWKKTVLFITYDEHGGFFDHVPPPRACDPLGDETRQLPDYAFDQLGFRVPLIVVSPFAKRHYVSHADTDHTSIARFIEHWLGLGALTARDANAWPFLDMFDFGNPENTIPSLPTAQTVAGCLPPP
jgi:phospholipase C